MQFPLSSAAMSFLRGALNQLGHECVERHADDIKQAIDEGWQRDYEAGGISTWGQNDD